MKKKTGASKLYGVNAAIKIVIFVLYCKKKQIIMNKRNNKRKKKRKSTIEPSRVVRK